MGSYAMRFGNRIVRYGERDDVNQYEDAGKEAKKGLAMIMEAIEENNLQSAKEGMEMAWEGVKTMCIISKEMKQQYGERSNDGIGMRGGYYGNRDFSHYGDQYENFGNRSVNYRHDDWNERDDEWMERRMRDARGRYM
jgi:hypothetical protein